MKTLKELGLTSHKTKNYANYVQLDRGDGKTDIICCGWMEVHDDVGSLGPGGNSHFDVRPLYWHRDGVFIYNFRNKWIGIARDDFINGKFPYGIEKSDDGFVFNAKRQHAFVPLKVAKRILKTTKKDYLTTAAYDKFVENHCEQEQTPKLVWEWGKQT